VGRWVDLYVNQRVNRRARQNCSRREGFLSMRGFSERPAYEQLRRRKSLANCVCVKKWDRCRASETIDIAGQLGADAAVSCGGGNFADAGYGAGTHESGPSRPLLRSASKVYKT
jgi:hypothetical protein